MFAFFVALPALAADFQATLDGQSYIVRTALASPDAARPWVWGVFLSDEAFTCEQVKSGVVNRHVSTKTLTTDAGTTTTHEVTGPADDTRFMTMFTGSMPGTRSGLVMGSAKGGVDLKLDKRSIVLESDSRLLIELQGERFSGTGSLAYTLCSPLGQRPAVSWKGKAADFTLTKVSQFDRPDQQLKVKVALPEGWKHTAPNKADYVIDDRWTAPDGLVLLSIAMSSPGEDFGAKRAQVYIDAAAPSGAKPVRNEAVGKGAWVLDYGDDQRRTLIVWR